MQWKSSDDSYVDTNGPFTLSVINIGLIENNEVTP